MMRWVTVLVLLAIAINLVPEALAHKSPIIEYGRAGMWRTGFSYIPRQNVVNEPITLTEEVVHLNGTIDGNVTAYFSVYIDHSLNKWYGGKEYKQLDWTLVHQAWGQPMPGPEGGYKFNTTFLVDQPGDYFVTVDLYEDGQYIGQDQRTMDVENRTLGPLYTTFSVVLIISVLIGVKRKVL